MAEDNDWGRWCEYVLADMERLDKNDGLLFDRVNALDKSLAETKTDVKLLRASVDAFIKEHNKAAAESSKENRADRRSGRGFVIAVVACVVSAVIGVASLVISILTYYHK